jgi:hypothetical protein
VEDEVIFEVEAEEIITTSFYYFNSNLYFEYWDRLVYGV